MSMFIHTYVYICVCIFICQYTYMVSIDGHMHLCDSSSRQFRIVLKPLEHILTISISIFVQTSSKQTFRMFTSSSRHLCPSGVSSHPPSGISAQAPGPGRSITWFKRLYLRTRLSRCQNNWDRKIGKSKTFKPASFDQVHIKHKRQSNSIKFTRFFRSMTVRDFSPFLPPPVAAVPSQEAFLYQTEEPKKNQQSGRSTDCGGQGKIFSQNMRIYIYNYIYILNMPVLQWPVHLLC